MTAFDSNLLEDALDVVGRQDFQYLAYASRTKNAAGWLVATRAAPVDVDGSFQPVPRQMYERLGLDLQKNFVTIFISKNVIDINRDVSGDQFIYAGKRYQAESRTDWFAQDGWDSILCVEVPSAG